VTPTWLRKQANHIKDFWGLIVVLIAVAVAGIGIGGTFLLFLFGWLILPPILWPYTVNSWLHVADVHWTMSWWMGYLFLFIPYVRRMMIPLALFTFILMLFLT